MNLLPRYWIVLAIIVYVLAAWFSVGHYHDDEYAQVLNFATSKIGIDMQSELMWEFKAGVRSGFQPFVAFALAKATAFIGINSPYILAFIYRLFSAVIALFATFVFIHALTKEILSRNIFKWTAFFLLFSWILLFINVRFSSEGWATSFFLLGLGLYLISPPDSAKHYLGVGLFLGLAFLARYQTGFMLVGLGLWMIFIHRIKPVNLFYILIAGCFVLLMGSGFDWWLYGKPTLSSWQYFMWHYNGLTSKSGGISVVVHEPWWFYIEYGTLQLLPPITLLLPFVVLSFWILFPKHPLTWLTIPFVLFHQAFGHKEMRYLFPVLPYAPVIFALVFMKVTEKYNLLKSKIGRYSWKLIFGSSVFINLTLVILVLSLPASKEVALWQHCLSPLAQDTNKPVLLVLDPDGSYSNPAELNLDFYNTHRVIIDSVRDETDIVEKAKQYPGKKLLYASRKRDRSQQLDDAGIQHELICRALPEWLLKININNWTSRTSMWRIWSLKLN